MVKVTPEEYAEKWARRLKGARVDIERGIERVDKAPTEKAVEKKEKFVQRLTEAIESGRWEEGLKKVGLEDWKEAMKKKALPRLSSGVDESIGKMENVGKELLPYIEKVQKEIQAMPDLTLDDAIERAKRWIQKMAEYKKK